MSVGKFYNQQVVIGYYDRLHQVRKVYRNRELIWQQPGPPPIQ